MERRIFIPGEDEPKPGCEGRDPGGIELDSIGRNHIRNNQCRDRIPHGQLQQQEDLEKSYKTKRRRSESTALYNCHGLSFANRRTRVYDPAALKLVLADDLYFEVPIDEVLPGDTILYVADDGDISHSGIVVEEPKKENFRIATVVSKWGSGGEFVHRATECPYSGLQMKFVRMQHG